MQDLDYIRDPQKIGKKSFEIIESLVDLSEFSESQKNVVKRVIHTTADFEFADIIRFSEGAAEKGIKALKSGASIVSDTRMVEAGINKRVLSKLGGKVNCYINTPGVFDLADKKGITRSMASMEIASKKGSNKIFAVGNAPTALFKLIELIKKGKIMPELIIGVPVGFVGAEESKLLLEKQEVPYILTRGRKGGSTVAVAIVNALMYMAKSR